MARQGFINVDAFQRDHTLEEAAAICGVHLDSTASGPNVRIDCPFNCDGDHAAKREIAVDSENAAKQWKCHAYGCSVRGNLLMLMYGWMEGKLPGGDKLRGKQFTIVRDLIAEHLSGSPPPERQPQKKRQSTLQPSKVDEAPTNIPLRKSERAEARALMEPPIWEKLTRDIASMSPEASAYVRRHPALSPEAMEEWNVGVMPKDGGGDKRGWSLRNHIIYPFRSEEGEVLGFVGRDPKYEDKLRAYEATPPEERDANKRPMKHRFPKGFHRGLELFGQEQLQSEECRKRIEEIGLVIVEGFNDVINLDALDVPAFAICSNVVSDEQVAKIARLASEVHGRVRLLFDCDAEGDAGAKDTAWKLLEAGLDVRPLWSCRMHGGKFAGRQPESISEKELQSLVGSVR